MSSWMSEVCEFARSMLMRDMRFIQSAGCMSIVSSSGSVKGNPFRYFTISDGAILTPGLVGFIRLRRPLNVRRVVVGAMGVRLPISSSSTSIDVVMTSALSSAT